MKKIKILSIIFLGIILTSTISISLYSCSGYVTNGNDQEVIDPSKIINIDLKNNKNIDETRTAEKESIQLLEKDINTLSKYFIGVNSNTINNFSVETKIDFPILSQKGELEIKLIAIDDLFFSNKKKALIKKIIIDNKTSIDISINNSFPTIDNIANAKIKELESNDYNTLKKYFIGSFTEEDLKYFKTTILIKSKDFNLGIPSESYVKGSMNVCIDAKEGYIINKSNQSIEVPFDIERIKIGNLTDEELTFDSINNNYYFDPVKMKSIFLNKNEYGFLKYDMQNNKSYSINKDFFEFFPNWKTINSATFNFGNNTKDNMIDKLEIGSNITYIGDDTFKFNNEVSNINTNNKLPSKITNFTMGENVREIGKYAFWNFLIKDKIIISNNIKKIGVQAFVMRYYNGNGGDPTLDPAIPKVNWNFIEKTILKEVVIGNGISEIPNSCFNGRLINDINFSTTLTSIKEYAFYANNRLFQEDFIFNNGYFWNKNVLLNNLSLPIYLQNIGIHAFGFNNINSISLPDSIKNIGLNAFESNKIKNPPNIDQSIGDKNSIFANQRF